MVDLDTWREIAESPQEEEKEIKEEGASVNRDCVTTVARQEIAKLPKEEEKGSMDWKNVDSALEEGKEKRARMVIGTKVSGSYTC